VARSRDSARLVRARAFAPGHVTGFFSPDLRERDPRARGSTGAGLVLELGVVAELEWRPGRSTRTTVSADLDGPLPISTEVARRLVPPRTGPVHIRLTHQMPVGQGFGMSAAGALATAFAVAGTFRIPRQRAVEVAHLAELFGGGGLGGVAAILGGGLDIREVAGVPPYGKVTHRRFGSPVIVGVVGGPLPSPTLLRNAKVLRRIESIVPTVRSAMTEQEFLEGSERFTDAAGLTSPPLRRLLSAIRSEGGWAAQAMFGRSFFAVPGSPSARRRILLALQRRGVPAVEVRTRRTGAALRARSH
jgi:pantoate kinase